MDPVDQQRRQLAWRAWDVALDALPKLRGATVLDLGCGAGDVAAALVARGARVIGVEGQAQLLAAAQARSLPRAEFRTADLRALPDPGAPVDGVWASFVAACFPDLGSVLPAWTRRLRPGGWVALTEVDDLFGHQPLGARTRAHLEAYEREALAAGRYDFHMGGKLCAHLRGAGFPVVRELELPDLELACDGPLRADALAGWRARLDGMHLLREACGAEFEAVRDEFLACLARPDHRATARVRLSLAMAPGP